MPSRRAVVQQREQGVGGVVGFGAATACVVGLVDRHDVPPALACGLHQLPAAGTPTCQVRRGEHDRERLPRVPTGVREQVPVDVPELLAVVAGHVQADLLRQFFLPLFLHRRRNQEQRGVGFAGQQ